MLEDMLDFSFYYCVGNDAQLVGYLAHFISAAKLPLWHHSVPGWELSARSRFSMSYRTAMLNRVFSVRCCYHPTLLNT